MYLTEDLYNKIFVDQYNEGYRILNVLSGYVTPAFVKYLLLEFDELKLNIIVGMTSHSGLSLNDHLVFLNLCNMYNDRLEVLYQTEKPGIHIKAYIWDDVSDAIIKLPKKNFVGSANMSHNAFFKQGELMVEINSTGYDAIYENVSTIDCRDDMVYESIDIYIEEAKRERIYIRNGTSIMEVTKQIMNKNFSFVDISFLSNGEVPSKSSLNWGQREGRNKDQAYIPVMKNIHNENPGFFPEKKAPFMITTDDGESILCVMAQDNSKAIHSMGNNGILGRYFRKRLGLKSGEFVKTEHLESYGRSMIRIYKIDNENYFLDFSLENK